MREALDSLVSPTARLLPDHPLCTLILIDIFLTNPDIPPIDNAREFAVHQLLTDMIVHEYAKQREIFDLGHPTAIENLRQAVHAIQDDAQTNSAELMGWCLLYFNYVRVDFNLTLPSISEHAGLVARTLRRYRQNTILRLTDEIIHQEWAARTERRRMRIISQFPQISPVRLFDREPHFATLEILLQEKQNAHVLISGVGGIGKTVFVQEVIRRQLDINNKGNVDHLIWIKSPNTLSEILQIVQANISIENTRVNIRDYLLYYHVVIVIDEVVALSPRELHELLSVLDPASVFLIGNILEAPFSDRLDTHIILGELSPESVHEYVNYLLRFSPQRGESTLNSLKSKLYNLTGGNPQNIRLALHNLDVIGDDSASSPPNLVANVFNTLTWEQKRLCIALALLPERRLLFRQITEVVRGDCDLTSLDILEQKRLVEVSEEDDERSISLNSMLREFIRQLCDSDPATKQEVVYILECLTSGWANHPLLVIEILVHAVIRFSIEWQRHTDVIEELTKLKQVHRVTDWFLLLDHCHAQNANAMTPSMKLAYAVALRRQGEWALSNSLLEEIQQSSGIAGDFSMQAHAHLELATLFRLRGRYEQALALLGIIVETVRRQKHQNLEELIILEHAQILIEQSKGEDAVLVLTSSMPQPTHLEWKLLMAEAHLLSGDNEKCRNLLNEALPLCMERHHLGRLYALLGRCMVQAGLYPIARHMMQTSIAYLDDDTLMNDFALARSKSNLAAILIRAKAFDKAEVLLREAQTVQTTFQDRVGLLATNANLQFLYESRGRG